MEALDSGAALVLAAETGDTAELRRLLEASPRLVNAAVEHRSVRELPTDTHAMRLLHVAIAADQLEVARLLLYLGADPDVRNADGRSPLHDSLELGRGSIQHLLRERGATVDICSAANCNEIDTVRAWLEQDPGLANDLSTHLSPVGWASFGGHLEMIRLLVEHGADPGEGVRPAVVTGKTEFLRDLLELGDIDLGRPFDEGDTALHSCGLMNYTDDASGVAQVLLDAGADPNARNPSGQTSLMRALSNWLSLTEKQDSGKRFDRIVDLLVRHGGREHFAEPDLRRLVSRAAERGETVILETLLGFHPGLIAATGGQLDQPLLHLAAANGHSDAVGLLLTRGFDVNIRDNMDNALALHFAAEGGHLEVVKQLVEAGSDVQGEGDDHEVGVLGWATCLQSVHEQVADYLLDRGARLTLFSAIALDRAEEVGAMVEADRSLLDARMSRNEHHRRPLHQAVHCNRPRMVRLLLELGADPGKLDEAGAPPSAYITGATDPDIVDALTEAGAELDVLGALGMELYETAAALVAADPDRIGANGRDTVALHLSVQRNNPVAVRWLIDHGADVNTKRELWQCNHTALHICAEHGRPEIARMLLDAGADPNIKDDKFDATVLGWAHHCGQPEVAELLEARGASR